MIDTNHEGGKSEYPEKNIEKIKLITDNNIIAFGGITNIGTIKNLLTIERVGAIAIGNALNYTENSISNIKSKLTLEDMKLRR